MSSLLVVLGLADEDTVSDDKAEEEDCSSDLSDCGESGPLSSLPSKFYNIEISK